MENKRGVSKSLLMIIVLGGTMTGAFWYIQNDKDTNMQREVPIQATYKTHIVYTTDAKADVTLLKIDCSTRGGAFNTCGSTCERDKICAAVCAYTCEFE